MSKSDAEADRKSGNFIEIGTITNVNENGTFQVTFDDGDFDEKVAPKHIRLL